MRHEDTELLHRLADGVDALLDVVCDIDLTLRQLVPPPEPGAVTAVLSTHKGASMTTITLDFVGATGTSEAAPNGDGSGLVVTFTSDGTATPGAATAGTDAAGNVNYSADVSVVADASVSNLSATVANTSGADLLDNDGVTAFVQPGAVAFTAPAPQATTATLTVS